MSYYQPIIIQNTGSGAPSLLMMSVPNSFCKNCGNFAHGYDFCSYTCLLIGNNNNSSQNSHKLCIRCKSNYCAPGYNSCSSCSKSSSSGVTVTLSSGSNCFGNSCQSNSSSNLNTSSNSSSTSPYVCRHCKKNEKQPKSDFCSYECNRDYRLVKY
jgi:hypothetical protein